MVKPESKKMSMKTRKILAAVIIAATIVAVLVVVDYIRPQSFIRTIFLRFQINELNDDIEAQEMLDKLIAEGEDPTSNIVVLSGTFGRSEGDRIYFKARESVETGEGVFIEFVDQIGIITKDTEVFRIILDPDGETGTRDIPIKLNEIGESEEIVVYVLTGDLPVGEVSVESIYVTY
jgi:hypothetical protein